MRLRSSLHIGEMAEWSNAAVLKTVVRLSVDRGFESLFLRNPNHPVRPPADGIFIFKFPYRARTVKGFENKNPIMSAANEG